MALWISCRICTRFGSRGSWPNDAVRLSVDGCATEGGRHGAHRCAGSLGPVRRAGGDRDAQPGPGRITPPAPADAAIYLAIQGTQAASDADRVALQTILSRAPPWYPRAIDRDERSQCLRWCARTRRGRNDVGRPCVAVAGLACSYGARAPRIRPPPVVIIRPGTQRRRPAPRRGVTGARHSARR